MISLSIDVEEVICPEQSLRIEHNCLHLHTDASINDFYQEVARKQAYLVTVSINVMLAVRVSKILVDEGTIIGDFMSTPCART